MTRPGWLLSDGSLVTVLVGFRELRMPAEALDIMLSGHIGGAALTAAYGDEVGANTPRAQADALSHPGK